MGEPFQHPLAPDPAFGFVALPQVLFPLFIRGRNSRRGCFVGSVAVGICLPAALYSTGNWPASFRGDGRSVWVIATACLRYYGGSDSCRTRSLPRVLSRQVSCVHCMLLARPTATNHRGGGARDKWGLAPGRATASSHGTLRWGLPEVALLAELETSPFARGLVSLAVPNRVHCVAVDLVLFRCFPPRLTATRLLQVLTRPTAADGRGLSSRRSVQLHSARAHSSRVLVLASRQNGLSATPAA